MGRWEPNARGRLEQAALDLYSERGFEQTTAAQIAERAGLTERTFFRHYADKREVLFGGSRRWSRSSWTPSPALRRSAAPIDAMATTLETVAAFFLERHEFARRRQAVIMANAELRERELIKLASLSAALATTLRRPRRQGPGREPHRGGGYRRLQGRVRALGRRQRGTYPGGLPARSRSTNSRW